MGSRRVVIVTDLLYIMASFPTVVTVSDVVAFVL